MIELTGIEKDALLNTPFTSSESCVPITFTVSNLPPTPIFSVVLKAVQETVVESGLKLYTQFSATTSSVVLFSGVLASLVAVFSPPQEAKINASPIPIVNLFICLIFSFLDLFLLIFHLGSLRKLYRGMLLVIPQ